jgi:hypothetical protein
MTRAMFSSLLFLASIPYGVSQAQTSATLGATRAHLGDVVRLTLVDSSVSEGAYASLANRAIGLLSCSACTVRQVRLDSIVHAETRVGSGHALATTLIGGVVGAFIGGVLENHHVSPNDEFAPVDVLARGVAPGLLVGGVVGVIAGTWHFRWAPVYFQ